MKSLNAFISWEQRGFCRSLKTRDAYSCPLVPDPSVKIGQASLSRSCSYRGQDFSFVLVTLSPNCFPIQTQAQMRPASDATATRLWTRSRVWRVPDRITPETWVWWEAKPRWTDAAWFMSLLWSRTLSEVLKCTLTPSRDAELNWGSKHIYKEKNCTNTSASSQSLAGN